MGHTTPCKNEPRSFSRAAASRKPRRFVTSITSSTCAAGRIRTGWCRNFGHRSRRGQKHAARRPHICITRDSVTSPGTPSPSSRSPVGVRRRHARIADRRRARDRDVQRDGRRRDGHDAPITHFGQLGFRREQRWMNINRHTVNRLVRVPTVCRSTPRGRRGCAPIGDTQ